MPDANLTTWITGVINVGFAVWVAIFLLTKFNKTLDDNIKTNREFAELMKDERAEILSALSRQTSMLEKLEAVSELHTALLKESIVKPLGRPES